MLQLIEIILTVNIVITKIEEAGGYNILHQTVTSSNKQNHINVFTKVPTTVEQGIKSEKIQPEKKDYFPGNTALSLQYPNYPVNGTAYSILLKFFGGVLVLIVMAVLVIAVRNKYRLYKKLNAIKGNLDDPRPVWTFESPRVPKSCTPGWAKDIEGPGISYVNSRTLRFVALRKDISITAAIYNVGMSSGKHVFACMWPRNQKYIKKGYLSIGLGQQSVEMYVEFSDYLLGATRDSLGFDLLKNAIYFDGKKIVSYPRGRSRGNALPTLFYMYVDMDKYKLWFASETEFWGVAINFKDLCTNSSTLVYPMVACRGVEGKFMLFYKGEVFATPPETEDTSPKQAESSGRKRYHYDILECIKQELKHSSDIRSIENRHGSLSTRKTDEDKLQTSFVYHNPAFELSRNSEPSTSFEEKFNVKSLENQKWESIRSEKETTLTSQQRLNNNSLVKKPCDKMKLPVISASCSGVQTIAFSGTCTYSKFNSGNSKDVGVEFCSVQDNQGFTDDEGNMYITSYL